MSGATQDFMKVMMMGVVTTAVYLTTIWISKGKAQLPVTTFLQSDQVCWSVFAREMHSTSQFDKTILSKSVCVCFCGAACVSCRCCVGCCPGMAAPHAAWPQQKRGIAGLAN